ncbi:oxygen-independent coproporphyrinogen-3 oxidase [Eubacterium uniforme]|uniref:Oxygen-independent coproporphyrinogen-3 oxidase n=1 Tax=Eubacterium uniforme TaxID=39495 RepID=A0A1T4V404_9FIRM|nr:oxygen-independent coproporphyrinogen-3 oxidase [Eubacterium uniforme]
MVIININPLDFKYDIETLSRAFYPGERFFVNKEVDIDEDKKVIIDVTFAENKINIKLNDSERSTEADFDDRADTKNRLKRLLYSMLVDETEKVLPWGTLTGIRPIKLALSKLEDGMDEEDVLDFMEEEYLASEEKSKLALKIAKREAEVLSEFEYKDGYSLYVGIPFCPKRCIYCSFASNDIEEKGDKVEDYLEALKKELSYIANACNELKLYTIYVGGGTPTALNALQLDELLKFITRTFNLTYLREFTVEAGRPDTIDEDKLNVMKKYGVSRISINPQTMNDKTLKLIGRNHTVKDVYEAFALAREYGFNNINMDFILGLPEETIEDVRNTMEQVLTLKPESITIHSLAIKRGAKLQTDSEEYKDLTFKNNEEMMNLASKYARELGMNPYYLYRQKNIAGNLENVGYSKYGYECLYNILIMEEKHNIIAAGAGSDSKFVIYHDEEDYEGEHNPEVFRVCDVKDLDNYIDRIEEMIERKREFIKENYNTYSIDKDKLESDMIDNIHHGILVSNLARMLGKEIGLADDKCYDLAVAGVLHDIGKLRLAEYLYGKDRDSLSIEKMRHIRMHSSLSYDIIKDMDFSALVKESVLYHHENYDGTGFPRNLEGEDIPLGARIIRVCDVFAALVSRRSYRDAFDIDSALNLLINEVKHFDMHIFLAFQRMINREEVREKVRHLLQYQADDMD